MGFVIVAEVIVFDGVFLVIVFDGVFFVLVLESVVKEEESLAVVVVVVAFSSFTLEEGRLEKKLAFD